MSELTMEHMLAIVKPHNDKIVAEARLADAERTIADLLALVKRYRKETPLGNQPHMIAHEADAAIAKAETRLVNSTAQRIRDAAR